MRNNAPGDPLHSSTSGKEHLLAFGRLLRGHPIVAFSVLACLFGWVLFIAAALGADLSPGALPLGPIVAATIVAAALGRPELKQWSRELAHVRAAPRWYAVALGAPLAIALGVVLMNHVVGAPLPTAQQLASWTSLPAEFVGILILIGIGEEAGWTAFAAPRILRTHSFLETWAILAAVRAIWHAPLMLSGQLPWVLGVVGNIAFQFLLLWLFLRGGSWFLAAIWHTMHNTMAGSFISQMLEGPDTARLPLIITGAYALLAAVILLLDRRALFSPRAANVSR